MVRTRYYSPPPPPFYENIVVEGGSPPFSTDDIRLVPRRQTVPYVEPAFYNPETSSAAAAYCWVEDRPWVYRRRPLYDHYCPNAGFEEFYGADTLRFYLSGAASDGAAQTDPDSALGNYRSATEATRLGYLQSSAIPGLTVALAGRRSLADDGLGVISAVNANTIRFFTDGGSEGTAITIVNGETKVLQDGTNASRFVRVTRTSANDLIGSCVLKFHDQYNNVWGMSDTSSAVATEQFRGPIVKSHGDVSSIYFRLNELGTSAVTSSAQLGGTGAGTIGGAANCFIDWPKVGYCRITNSGGTLKEIVYYSSRTDTVLTVPSSGRQLLDTTNTAGAASDIARAVPGVAIGYENCSPLAGGSIQTIADQYTAPSGITWKTGTTNAGGIGPLSLKDGEQVGLWIRRATPSGSVGWSKHYTQIACEFTTGATTYTEYLGGLWRFARSTEERYELHIGTNAEPDITAAPTETFSSLPYETTATFTGSNTYYLVVNKRNKYGLVTQSTRTTVLRLVSDVESLPLPDNPRAFVFTPAAAGAFRLRAVYYAAVDGANPATHWAIYMRTNGTDPVVGVDSPTLVAMDASYSLDYTTATFSHGTDGRVILKVKRNSDSAFSTDETVHQATATTTAPSVPQGGTFMHGVAEVL